MCQNQDQMILAIEAPEVSKVNSSKTTPIISGPSLQIVVTEKSISIPNYLNFQKKLVPEPGSTTFLFEDIIDLEIVESSGYKNNTIPRHFRIGIKNDKSHFEVKESLFRITCSFEDEVRLRKALKEQFLALGLLSKLKYSQSPVNSADTQLFSRLQFRRNIRIWLGSLLFFVLTYLSYKFLTR